MEGGILSEGIYGEWNFIVVSADSAGLQRLKNPKKCTPDVADTRKNRYLCREIVPYGRQNMLCEIERRSIL